MPWIIALAFIAIAALIIASFAVHFLFSPWLLVAVGVAVVSVGGRVNIQHGGGPARAQQRVRKLVPSFGHSWPRGRRDHGYSLRLE